MHKSVLYLICTCEQPSAPGSYRRPGKAGGYPRKKKATCLQSLNAVSQQAPSGMGGGRWTKTDGRRRKDTSSVYMLRVPPASERGAGEAAFSLETRVAAAARGRGWGSPRAPPASMGSRSEAGGLGAPRTPRRPGRATRPPGVPPRAARRRPLGCSCSTWREAEDPLKNTPTPHAPSGQGAPRSGRRARRAHLAARQRSGSGSGGGGGGGSSMAAEVTAQAGGGTGEAAASLIRARGPAWPRRAASGRRARGARGAPGVREGLGSAPAALARRGSRSRRGHLGDGGRPAPGYGGRRGTRFRGRRAARDTLPRAAGGAGHASSGGGRGGGAGGREGGSPGQGCGRGWAGRGRGTAVWLRAAGQCAAGGERRCAQVVGQRWACTLRRAARPRRGGGSRPSSAL